MLAACASNEAPAATATETPEPGTGTEVAKVPEATPAAVAPPPAPAAPKATQAFVVEAGLATPESVLHDVERDVYYVSNINGSPLEADDNGYITKLGADGKVLVEKLIDGAAKNVKLNAPKGMALVGEVLYVNDLDHVRMFDAETGKPKGQILIKGATFLNDLVAGEDGTVYTSDSGFKAGANGFEPSGTDAVYKIGKDKKPQKLIGKPELGGPNGLALVGGALVVATFGSGELYTVALDGTQGTPLKVPSGQLDGVVALADGRLIVSSWGSKSLLAGKLGEPLVPVVENVESPADFGYDAGRNRVLVPLFNANKVVAYDLPK
jgi:sugar lactone lactonase YvrE